MNQQDYSVGSLIKEFQALLDINNIAPKYQEDIKEVKKLNETVNSIRDKIGNPILSKNGLEIFRRKIVFLQKKIDTKILKLLPELQSKQQYYPPNIENEEMNLILKEIDNISLEINLNKERLKNSPELKNVINIIIAELSKRKANLESKYNNITSSSDLELLKFHETIESLGGKVDRSKLVSRPKLEVSAISVAESGLKKSHEKRIMKKYFENPEEFFNSIKNATLNDSKYINLAEQKLLQIDGDRVEGKDNHKDSNNTKAWEERKALIRAQYELDSNDFWVVTLAPSMIKWERSNLVDISFWRKYSHLNNQEQQKQIIAHTVGIGVHPLLNDQNLTDDYTENAYEGFYMYCLVKLKDGNKIFGKIHLILNEENKVFHRMFFETSTDVEPENFLLEREDLEDSSKVSRETLQKFSYLVHKDGSIEYSLESSAFIKSYTIFNIKENKKEMLLKNIT